VISQKTRTKKAVIKVAAAVPHLNPKIGMQSAVIIADIATFTKLLPINRAAINLSILETIFCICLALLTPWETIWRKRILLKAIIEVSEAERKNEKTARIKNIIKAIRVSIFNLK